MIELRGARVDRAPAPGQLAAGIGSWRAARDAEWQELVRQYQEAVGAFRRVVAITDRRLGGRPPRRPSAPPAPRARSVAPRVRAAAPAPPEVGELTARQREIARLIAVGMTNRQIATELVLTEGTVANHVRHILLRLGMRCRAQVAAWVVAGRRPDGRAGEPSKRRWSEGRGAAVPAPGRFEVPSGRRG